MEKTKLKKIWDIIVYTFLYSLLGVLLILILSFVSIFVPFNSKSYDKIAIQAATLFGIEEDEYTFQITDDMAGSWWSGMGGYATSKFSDGWEGTDIYIRKGMPRNVTIYSIFHEFAHAAQAKYIIDKDLDDDKFYENIEKQAGAEAHRIMLKNGYWWECYQLLYWNLNYALFIHPQYAFIGQLFQNTFTGTNDLRLRY